MTRIVASEIRGDALAGAGDVVAMCQAGTVAGLSYATKDPSVFVTDVETETYPVLGQWMSVILVMTPVMRMTLKFFYNGDQARRMTARTLRRDSREVNQALADDFMRELANTASGHVKRALERAKVVVGVSLPLVTSGFDNVFYDPSKATNSFSACWGLETDTGERVVVGLDIDILDKRGFLAVNWVREVGDDGGEMEFL